MELFIVGKFISERKEGTAWEFQGVYEKETVAIEHCTNNNYFIGPVKLNTPIPEETTDWPDLYYPHEVV